MTITIIKDKTVRFLEIAGQVFTEFNCIVMIEQTKHEINGAFFGTDINNHKFSFN